jgi:hypothetical protein
MTLTDREKLESIRDEIVEYLKETLKDPEEQLVRNRLEILQNLNSCTVLTANNDYLKGMIHALRWTIYFEEKL